mmetsp:Transcript_3526/g.6755  ORF Transcript_3526/g.6755 Transcript_3526/m.6755 type:complete len:246 (-) Transcript_3526:1104-1841(-)
MSPSFGAPQRGTDRTRRQPHVCVPRLEVRGRRELCCPSSSPGVRVGQAPWHAQGLCHTVPHARGRRSAVGVGRARRCWVHCGGGGSRAAPSNRGGNRDGGNEPTGHVVRELGTDGHALRMGHVSGKCSGSRARDCGPPRGLPEGDGQAPPVPESVQRCTADLHPHAKPHGAERVPAFGGSGHRCPRAFGVVLGFPAPEHCHVHPSPEDWGHQLPLPHGHPHAAWHVPVLHQHHRRVPGGAGGEEP